MGDEAYHERECQAVEGNTERTLVVRGGYGRDEVWIGICASRDGHPDDLIAVSLRDLRRVLSEMGPTERPRQWQCFGCKFVFSGRYRDVCRNPECKRIGYWSGSVDPRAKEWIE